MKVTATTDIRMPITMLGVSASLNTSVPTRIAVIGSNTPSTDALVAPMFLVAIARVAVDTIVGNTARPTRFIHAVPESSPVISSEPDVMLLVKKITAPTDRA